MAQPVMKVGTCVERSGGFRAKSPWQSACSSGSAACEIYWQAGSVIGDFDSLSLILAMEEEKMAYKICFRSDTREPLLGDAIFNHGLKKRNLGSSIKTKIDDEEELNLDIDSPTAV
ncbi:MAG: hypothetical protein JOZ29_18780, partial [Deltaproteobacteria bacterium]|nr:hypothetical protein [Deltaproteobacteria bacterium]